MTEKTPDRNWCKIISTPNRDVFVERIYPFLHGSPALRITAAIDGRLVNYTLAFPDDASRDKAYDLFDHHTYEKMELEGIFKDYVRAKSTQPKRVFMPAHGKYEA
jgi:hypothetical protein